MKQSQIFSRKGPANTVSEFMSRAEALFENRQYDAAEQLYKKILRQGPNPFVYAKLAEVSRAAGRFFEVAEYLEKAVEIEPDNSLYLANLGTILISTGRAQQGIERAWESIEKTPKQPSTHSSFLANLHYLPEIDRQMIFEEHKKWGHIHAPVTMAKVSGENDPAPDRRLRVGYISADFRRHPVAYFFKSILDEHDHQAVEIYGYGDVACPDPFTEHLETRFDHYRNIYGLDDEAVAERIERDKIDVLVDLAGHTSKNRLLVMARKPAPVQAMYLGYFDTTGTEQIDYFLTDSIIDPPQSQKFYTEKLVFLPGGFLCYTPLPFTESVSPLPAIEKGYVTFGCFCNNMKIHPFIIELWAQILKASSNSRIVLKFKGGNDPQLQDYYHDQFSRFGINKQRVAVCGFEYIVNYFKVYNDIDIMLDTYPFNGGTTTCDGLWMGVPIISLVGQHHVSRAGLSILSRLGLGYFAASAPDEYVTKAIALAKNLDALAKIRASMRQRMAASPLCDAKAYARDIETAYRKMWYRWCEKQGAAVPDMEFDSDVEFCDTEIEVCSSQSNRTTADVLEEV